MMQTNLTVPGACDPQADEVPRLLPLAAWIESEFGRGALAFAPRRLPCLICGGCDGIHSVTRPVTGLVVGVPGDAGQVYRLACGHRAIEQPS